VIRDWFGELVSALGAVGFVGGDGEVDDEVWSKEQKDGKSSRKYGNNYLYI